MVTVGEPAAGLIPTLPGRCYIVPGIFSAEQAAIFESLWFCAMRSADVAGPGGFRTVQVGQESVIVARSTDGELRAFLNLCRQRGRVRTVGPGFHRRRQRRIRLARVRDRGAGPALLRGHRPPSGVRHLMPDHVIAHRMFPFAADRTIVECDWLFDPWVVAAGHDLSRRSSSSTGSTSRTSPPVSAASRR